MEDHKLQTFCAVVESESFSRAAEVKSLTQSAISHLVKNLEQELGTRLLFRRNRAVKPTPAGLLYYQHAKKILSDYERLAEDIRELLHEIKGPLRIGADAMAAAYLLPQLIYQFRLTYDQVVVHVSIKNPKEMLQGLYDADIDFAITEETLTKGCQFEEKLVDDDLVLIAPENHSLAGKTPVLPEDLSARPFVIVGSRSNGSGVSNIFFKNMGLDPESLNIVMVTESQDFAIQMVRYGIGLSVVSKWAVFKDIREGVIVTLNVIGKRIPREFKMIRAEKDPVTAVARAFLEFVRHYHFFVPF